VGDVRLSGHLNRIIISSKKDSIPRAKDVFPLFPLPAHTTRGIPPSCPICQNFIFFSSLLVFAEAGAGGTDDYSFS
jgi:hypothetical protein